MADVLTPAQRQLNMQRIRARNTRPEIHVRRLLHRHGLRFRLHRQDLPGQPDIVLPRHRLALFVHGCFWHGHTCALFKVPATRTEFWLAKIAANTARDQRAFEALGALGWRRGCVWECALKGADRLSEDVLGSMLAELVRSSTQTFEVRGEVAVGGKQKRRDTQPPQLRRSGDSDD